MVPLPPLDSPKPSFKPRRPSVARQNARGSQGRSVLQGSTLDGSRAFRSGTTPPCTVWPRTVMRGGLRKVTSGHNSIPKSARRTEPSPRNLRLAANASLSGLKEGLGCQEGKGNHRCPVPSCLRRETPALSAARRRQCHAMSWRTSPRPGGPFSPPAAHRCIGGDNPSAEGKEKGPHCLR